MQQDYFDRHMALAGRLDLPFIVHMRDCDADIMAALRAEHRRRGPLRGIMHSFTGDAAMAAECMALGLHISFAGMVTYKKSQPLRDCAATIPADRLLIETDCPYLSPEPVRGKRPNEPAYVRPHGDVPRDRARRLAARTRPTNDRQRPRALPHRLSPVLNRAAHLNAAPTKAPRSPTGVPDRPLAFGKTYRSTPGPM